MRRIQPLLACVSLPLLLIGFSGCGGGGPTIVPVSGTLKYKGKPVTNARIDFVPENGRPSSGVTDQNGHYELEYTHESKGAVVGKHKVSVVLRPSTAAEQEAAMMGKAVPLSKDMQEFFSKYAKDRTTKEVTVDKNSKVIDLDLD